MTVQIAVLGGGYAGVLAARRLASNLGPAARVTLVTASDRFVERIRLHEVAAGRSAPTHPLASLVGGAALELATIRALDPVGRRVELDGRVIRPDFVVNALGSATRRTLPGAEHALALDGVAAAAQVRAIDGPIAVIGGGLTAIELASELAGSGRGAVTLFTRGAVGDGALGARGDEHARAVLRRLGVTVVERAAVDAIEPLAVIADGVRHRVAATVLCSGFVASPVAAAAGLAVDHQGRMLVTEALHVDGNPWLWGAGDAAMPAVSVGAPLHMACKTAMPMAVSAADNLAAVIRGRAPRAFRFGDSGVCVSLGRSDGVIQLRDAAGHHRRAIRGRPAAWIKESVCRFTVRALRWPAVQGTFRLYARRGRAALAATPRPALPEPS